MNKLIVIIIFLFANVDIFAQHPELVKNIESLVSDKRATVGVAVIFDDSTTLTINNDYRYPTMSVYKFPIALAVLNYLDTNNLSLNTEIYIKKSDLLPNTHSPLRETYPDGNLKISIRDLLTYSVSLSDNNACDILINYLGGTSVINEYIKNLGITDISIVATEAVMNQESNNQYLNWTTPSASTLLLEIFLKKDLFSPIYKNFLIETMIGTTTGANKIKYLLPTEAVVGHKTGSSSRNEFGIKIAENDLGFVRLPNGKSFSIGIFVMNSKEDDQTNCSIIADISKAVYNYYITE